MLLFLFQQTKSTKYFRLNRVRFEWCEKSLINTCLFSFHAYLYGLHLDKTTFSYFFYKPFAFEWSQEGSEELQKNLCWGSEGSFAPRTLCSYVLFHYSPRLWKGSLCWACLCLFWRVLFTYKYKWSPLFIGWTQTHTYSHPHTVADLLDFALSVSAHSEMTERLRQRKSLADKTDESRGRKEGNEGINRSWKKMLRSVMCLHVVIKGTQGW